MANLGTLQLQAWASLPDETRFLISHGGQAYEVTKAELTAALGATSSVTLVQDFVLGFIGTPTAGQIDWLLAGRGVTITAASPGQAFCRTAPTGTQTYTLRRNGTNVGTVAFAAGSNTGAFTVSADIVLAAGDRLELVAPNPAPTTQADIQVLLRGTLA